MFESTATSSPFLTTGSACSSSDYEQAMEYLFSRINYERIQPQGKPAKAFKLERMQKLLDIIGNPQTEIPVIHIAGTKGKGSTAAMIAEILQRAGYRTGLFTSPHISKYEERIQVNGIMPSTESMIDLIRKMQKSAEQMEQLSEPMPPTFFEITTAIAWLYFIQKNVDVAIMEVGLGGRLDSTNICNPVLTIITNISYDHTAILGKTLPKIAREKGGIIKEGIPVICGIQNEAPLAVVQQICKERSAPLIQREKDFSYTFSNSIADKTSSQVEETLSHKQEHFRQIDVKVSGRCWNKIPVPLAGRHQEENATLAVVAADSLHQLGWKISEKAVQQGMQSVRLPVRIELMQTEPTIIIDAAHNDASIKQLIETIVSEKKQKRHLVFATSRDKDVRSMLELLLPAFDSVILTQYLGNPRAFPVEDLVSLASSIDNRHYHIAKTPCDAWQIAQQLISKSDLLCITGSFFIAAEMRELVTQNIQKKE